jgi:hypothetical protein
MCRVFPNTQDTLVAVSAAAPSASRHCVGGCKRARQNGAMFANGRTSLHFTPNQHGIGA